MKSPPKSQDSPRDALYPPVEPFDAGLLDAGDGHHVYYEQCGRADGLPVLFLHGGPGSGCTPRQRRFFDPARYRAVLFDQRGTGRSTPRGAVHHNTTDHLLQDIEALRVRLGIERWLVFGGSWGSSLALAYCAQHKAACLGLILRGIFLTGRRDLEWLFQQTGQLLPEEWARFAAAAPKRHRRDLLGWCERRISRGDGEAARDAVLAWVRYEDAVMAYGQPAPPAPPPPDETEVRRLLDKYRIQAHYLTRRCFLDEARVLDCAARCHGLPAAILHGRLDLVCRPESAWRLHRTMHGSRLAIIEGAGHSPFDPPLAAALVSATDHFAAWGNFDEWEGGGKAFGLQSPP